MLLPACTLARSAAPPVPVVEGRKLSTNLQATQPSIAVGSDGKPWVAWIEHDQDLDRVVAHHAGAIETVTPEPGQYLRPVLVVAGGEPWCFFTISYPDRPASIWYSRRGSGGWSAPQALLPGERRAHQNPDAAVSADGRLAVAYQIDSSAGYDIQLRSFERGAWSKPRSLGVASAWDPALVFDRRGGLHLVYTGYRDGDYDLFWVTPSGASHRIGSPGEYDLHPSLAAAPDGAVWLAWDAIRIPGHLRSGPSTISGANLKHPVDDSFGSSGAETAVEVRVLDGDQARIPGSPREQILPPPEHLFTHAAVPKIAVSESGEPWVTYRSLRRKAPYPAYSFYWDVSARPLRGGIWGPATLLANSDGYQEEAALAPTASGISVVYTGERRAQVYQLLGDASVLPGGGRWRFVSDLYLATLAGSGGAPSPSLLRPGVFASGGSENFQRVRSSIASGGVKYQLLFGDTHRHSNISRCSLGGEPNPGDLYRYGSDMSRYDFVALSDHVGDLDDTFSWARAEKQADLYNVPGRFSVLYNFEWSPVYPSGHHNTIFPSRPTRLLSSTLAGAQTLEQGWELLAREGYRALTIPHTMANSLTGTSFATQDDRFRRVVEIFQACRGSYEHAGCPRIAYNTTNHDGFYWSALERGYHLGVIASSDHGWGVSYAGVWAPQNTREAIFQSLFDRRCYGASSYGILLDVRSGPHWMGEIFSSKAAPPIDIHVHGTAPLRSVEILGRSRVLHADGSLEHPLGRADYRLRWRDPEFTQQTGEQWYYVRVTQDDDEMAWSSPMWVTPAR